MKKYLLTCLSLTIFFTILIASGGMMTGCDLLDSSDEPDTVSEEKLSSPNNLALTVTARDSVRISFTGKNFERNFKGYVLVDPSDLSTIYDTIVFDDDFNGDTAFYAEIDPDVQKTWGVAAMRTRDKISVVQSISFLPRVMTAGMQVSKLIAGTNNGINIDNVASVVKTRADIDTVNYADHGGAEFSIEGISSTSDVTLTPLNGAVIFESDSTTLYTESEISTIHSHVKANTPVSEVSSLGVCGFYAGKSIRETCSATGTLKAIAEGDVYIIISSALDVARIIVDVVGSTTIEFSVYKDSPSDGILLYKDRK